MYLQMFINPADLCLKCTPTHRLSNALYIALQDYKFVKEIIAALVTEKTITAIKEDAMKTRSLCFSTIARTTLILSTLILAGTYTSTSNAAQGCGYGMHRSVYGGCIGNHPGAYSTGCVML